MNIRIIERKNKNNERGALSNTDKYLNKETVNLIFKHFLIHDVI